MKRDCRYQAAIVRGDAILMIEHELRASRRRYWIIPGGGMDPGETEEQCVRREILEETGLEITVVGLLFEDTEFRSSAYRRSKTYLCAVQGGEPRPGFEPEAEHNRRYTISAVSWFNLRDPVSWPAGVAQDAETGRVLAQIRDRLGFLPP